MILNVEFQLHFDVSVEIDINSQAYFSDFDQNIQT